MLLQTSLWAPGVFLSSGQDPAVSHFSLLNLNILFMAFKMVAGETRQMSCRIRMQFQGGDKAQRIMNPEKSKSTLINSV